MKTIIKIAWRNLWRHKRRSMVVVFSIAIGVFLMIFTMGFMNGMNVQMVENTISTSLGHIAIHEKGFQDNMKIEKNFYPEKRFLKIIKKSENFKAFAPKVKVQGMIRSSEASRGVMVVGIDPEKEKKISKIYDYTSKEDGSQFLDSLNEDSILISKSMAKKLDLVLGDRIVLMFQNEKDEIVGEGVKIKGLFTTPVDSFDKFVVFVGIKKIQEVTGIGENVSEITVLLNDKKWVDVEKKRISKMISNNKLEILSWKDMAPNLVKAIDLFDAMMYLFFGIIFITVLFSIVNTLVMSIMERFHEIGVMKSIGTRPSWIFFMVIFEAINLGIVGLIFGLGSGLLLILILSIYGIDFSFYMEAMRNWGTGGIIYPLVKIKDLVGICMVVFFTTIVAAIYPAYKAAKIKPLDALHYI